MDKVISIDFTREQYEQKVSVLFSDGTSISDTSFKEAFKFIRDKHKVRLSSSFKVDNVFKSAWRNTDNELQVDFIKDNVNDKHFKNAILTYEFNVTSSFYKDFITLFYKITEHIKEEYTNIPEPVNINGTSITVKDILKRNFLEIMERNKGQFSQSFIDKTIDCIDKGIYTVTPYYH